MASLSLELNRQLAFRIFFVAAFLFLLYQLVLIVQPFFTPLAAAAALVIIFHPLHVRSSRAFPRHPNLAAGASTTLVVLLAIVPVLLLTWLFMRQAVAVLPTVTAWLQNLQGVREGTAELNLPPRVQDFADLVIDYTAKWGIDVKELVLNSLDQLGERVSHLATSVLRNLVFTVFDVCIMGFGMFFFFRDGRRMVRSVLESVPMEQVHKEELVQRLDTTLSAVVRGVFITATLQGLLAGVGFAAAGIPFAVLLGFLTALLALVPFLGAAAVWIPVCFYAFYRGPLWLAVVLLIWCVLVVSLVDNILKPFLIGARAGMPIFLLFFAILGGLQLYGFLGILIGPLMVTALMSFANVYREQLRRASAPAPPITTP